MSTLKKETEIAGICLMDGKESNVRLLPSDKKGIYFYPDNSDTGIKACLENVVSTQNCVVLGNNNKNIKLVEHFMAACAFSGIDRLEVHTSSSELPILDGSALNWIEAFNNAGIQENATQEKIDINEPIYLSAGKRNIVLLPSNELSISYCINFNHPDLENRWFNWSEQDDNKQIYEARTFGYLKDLEKFQREGLALGASAENTVGLTDTGYTTELRSKYEPVKHKILDIIGDISLLINPFKLNAHIIAQNAGHGSHVEFAKVIREYMEKIK